MADKKNRNKGIGGPIDNITLPSDVVAREENDVRSALSLGSEPKFDELIQVNDEQDIRPTTNKRYREIECSRCYQLLPKNKMASHEIQKISGESSGSNWSSQLSSSTGYNGKLNNFRVNASKRVGKSSGRTYYKNSTIWLCPDCNFQFLEEEKQKFFNQLLIAAFVFIAVISVIFLVVVF